MKVKRCLLKNVGMKKIKRDKNKYSGAKKDSLKSSDLLVNDRNLYVYGKFKVWINLTGKICLLLCFE